jgi:hypothetical protein
VIFVYERMKQRIFLKTLKEHMAHSQYFKIKF